jgi:hypothetical protein
MSHPELLAAYGVAGSVIAVIMLTALRIVRGAGTPPTGPRPREDRIAKIFWPPVAPTRR